MQKRAFRNTSENSIGERDVSFLVSNFLKFFYEVVPHPVAELAIEDYSIDVILVEFVFFLTHFLKI